MSRLEKIRTSKTLKLIIYIFLGVFVFYLIDNTFQLYFELTSKYIQKEINDETQKKKDKLRSDELYYHNVDSLAYLNKHNEAIKLTELRILDFPNEKASLTRHIGNIYFHKGDIDSAIIKYTEAIKLTTRYLEAYSDRGWAFVELDSLDLAIKDFELVASYNMDYNLYLGIAQEKKDLIKDALNSYKTYLKHYPDKHDFSIKLDSIKKFFNKDF